jgi:choline dehydrogenase-like flavoprotein
LDAELCDYHVCDLPRSRHQPNLDSTRTRITNVIEQSTGVFSTADLLLDSLTTDPYIGRNFLTINLNHLVTSIETKDSRAVAVHCRDLAGNVERRFVASHIVLAAGSLESPRVALASGLNDPYHKMGIGLTDHPAYVHDDPVEIDPTSIHAGAEHHAKILIRHRDGASHPYWAELVINPRYWDVRHSDDEVLRLATRSTTKTFATMKFLFDSPLNDDNSIEYRGPGQKLVVNVAANLRGIPYETEVTGLRNRVFTFLNAVFDPTKKMDYHCNGSVHHAGGSLRMSDDHSGVVDENLKFEAYDNLYCCDVSTFPRIPTANPSLTLIALAQRLAARLKSIT